MKSGKIILSAAVAAAALPVALPAAARAAARPEVTISVPSYVIGSDRLLTVTGRLSARGVPLGAITAADWFILPGGHAWGRLAGEFYLRPAQGETADAGLLYPGSDPTGEYTVAPDEAYLANGKAVAQNMTHFWIRAASRARITAARSGGTVTYTVSATYWNVDAAGGRGGYTSFAHAPVTVNLYNPASGKYRPWWKGYTDEHGSVSFATADTGTHRVYALTGAEPAIIGSASGAIVVRQ